MISRFQGDPKIYMSENGATLKFISGQPVMDQGIENQAVLSLFGGSGWWANSLINNKDRHLDTDFEIITRGAITLQKLNEIQQSVIRNLKNKVFGDIKAIVYNPSSSNIAIEIPINPPGKNLQELKINRTAQNWINQAKNPAYER